MVVVRTYTHCYASTLMILYVVVVVKTHLHCNAIALILIDFVVDVKIFIAIMGGYLFLKKYL